MLGDITLGTTDVLVKDILAAPPADLNKFLYLHISLAECFLWCDQLGLPREVNMEKSVQAIFRWREEVLNKARYEELSSQQNYITLEQTQRLARWKRQAKEKYFIAGSAKDAKEFKVFVEIARLSYCAHKACTLEWWTVVEMLNREIFDLAQQRSNELEEKRSGTSRGSTRPSVNRIGLSLDEHCKEKTKYFENYFVQKCLNGSEFVAIKNKQDNSSSRGYSIKDGDEHPRFDVHKRQSVNMPYGSNVHHKYFVENTNEFKGRFIKTEKQEDVSSKRYHEYEKKRRRLENNELVSSSPPSCQSPEDNKHNHKTMDRGTHLASDEHKPQHKRRRSTGTRSSIRSGYRTPTRSPKRHRERSKVERRRTGNSDGRRQKNFKGGRSLSQKDLKSMLSPLIHMGRYSPYKL